MAVLRSCGPIQKAVIVYDATVRFCDRFIAKRGDRTRDQMIQAARSGKQNIVEGSQVSGTSKELELKLVNVARVSLEELAEDYRDFLRLRGADLKVHVRTPRQAELAVLVPEKLPPDTSRFLLCPMPGLVVKINVEEGDEVQEGQALATVEAMKMENILRAERKGVVKRIAAAAGSSLRVDDIIMEFE